MYPSRNRTPLFFLVFSSLFFSKLCLALKLHNNNNILDDAKALLAFKGNLTNPSILASSWKNMNQICTSWIGVTCSDIIITDNLVDTSLNRYLPSNLMYRRVRSLHLPGKELYGPICVGTLGKLDMLETLSLHHNRLTGTLPYDLINCTSLREVYLSHNLLHGNLAPSSSSSVDDPPTTVIPWPPLLQHLDLSFNNFSGEIPWSFDNLGNLRILALQNNTITGSIPSLPRISTKLRSFNVANNNLDGSIPHSLSRFPEESFIGNSGLCGYPLQDECTTIAPSPSDDTNNSFSSVNTSNSNKLSVGSIIAIVVVGCVIVVATLSFLVCVLLTWTKRRSKRVRADKRPTIETMYGNDVLYSWGRNRGLEFHSSNRGSVNMSIMSGGRVVSQPSVNTQITDGHRMSRSSANTLVFFSGQAGRGYVYGIDDLLRASAEVLGKGGFGTSYKAFMADGLTLCVKRLRDVMCSSDHDEIACKIIVNKLGRLEHPNLVCIRAYFFSEKEKLLVTDYMPRGSLSALLHGKNEGPVRWRTRLSIAAKMAKGLVFLHSKKIVHGAIKSSNVLLDKGGEARWSDYGLMQMTTLTKPEPGMMTRLKPNGYTPPEVGPNLSSINYKGDVYSFGVLLLELLTGKSPMALDEEGVLLPRWVESHTELTEVLDRPIAKYDHIHHADMLHLLHNVALPCVFSCPDKRPHMVEVEKHIKDLQNQEHRR